jgi:prepilin peptidase CpaA
LVASLLVGALALLLLAFRAMPTVPPLAWAPWVAGLQDKSKGVPYGIALSAAALVSYRDTALYHALMAMA